MGSLARRLKRLESSAGTSTQEQERALNQEVLRRLTDDELCRYEAVLEQAIAWGGSGRALPEDEPAVRRVWEIYEEVRSEFA